AEFRNDEMLGKRASGNEKMTCPNAGTLIESVATMLPPLSMASKVMLAALESGFARAMPIVLPASAPEMICSCSKGMVNAETSGALIKPTVLVTLKTGLFASPGLNSKNDCTPTGADEPTTAQ